MHRHDADALAPLLHYGGLRRLAFALLGELRDEPAKRNTARGFPLARQFRNAEDIGESPLAGLAEDEHRVRPRGGEQRGDGLLDGAIVAPPVQVAEQAQALDDRVQVWGRRFTLTGLRYAEGVQAADARAVLEQRLVAHREQWPAQGAIDGQLVIRPLDGGERGAQTLDLLPLMERLAADQHVRDAPRLERLDIRLGDVGAPLRDAAKEQADVARRHRDLLPWPVALRHAPAAVLDEPPDERGHRVRQRGVDGRLRQSPAPVGTWHGKRHDAGLARPFRPVGRERDVAGLERGAVLDHARGERRVDEPLHRWQRAEARGQLDHGRAPLAQEVLDLLVDADVRAAEAVDRLLRIADHEELAGGRRHVAPPRRGRIIAGEQQEDLRLERVGILELVDEDVAEAALELRAHVLASADEIAAAEQEVE